MGGRGARERCGRVPDPSIQFLCPNRQRDGRWGWGDSLSLSFLFLLYPILFSIWVRAARAWCKPEWLWRPMFLFSLVFSIFLSLHPSLLCIQNGPRLVRTSAECDPYSESNMS